MTEFLKKWKEQNASFDPKRVEKFEKLSEVVDVLLAVQLPELIDSELADPLMKLKTEIGELVAHLTKIDNEIAQLTQKKGPFGRPVVVNAVKAEEPTKK
jgi:hypothetical protein